VERIFRTSLKHDRRRRRRGRRASYRSARSEALSPPSGCFGVVRATAKDLLIRYYGHRGPSGGDSLTRSRPLPPPPPNPALPFARRPTSVCARSSTPSLPPSSSFRLAHLTSFTSAAARLARGQTPKNFQENETKQRECKQSFPYLIDRQIPSRQMGSRLVYVVFAARTPFLAPLSVMQCGRRLLCEERSLRGGGSKEGRGRLSGSGRRRRRGVAQEGRDYQIPFSTSSLCVRARTLSASEEFDGRPPCRITELQNGMRD